MIPERFFLIFLLVCLFASSFSGTSISQPRQPDTALLLTLKGTVGPAVSDYISRGLQYAADKKAGLVILEMDTPGGLDYAMRDIIKNILASPVPVAAYVSPAGSRAASAGTYILYASHVAVMAPATNLGAATPVQIGGLPGLPDKNDGQKKNEDSLTTMERKIINDAEAYIRSLAAMHGRNADWAAKAVRESVSLTAEDALKIKVIDLLAEDLHDLLLQADGREVLLGHEKIVLTTQNMAVEKYEPDWRSRLLTVISDPNVAYLLMLLGMYGLIFELANPGYVLPGVAGAICLLLALYTFQVLPINYAGLALIALGIFFMIAEAFVPSFGALGIGGLIAFVIGSIILMDEKSLQISLPLISGTAVSSALFFLWLIGRLLAVSSAKVQTGAEGLIGSIGEAMNDFEGEGRIWVHGESWKGICPASVKKGQKVRVVSKNGLQLNVEILEEEH
ncbi:MAG: nodulation protein NfeD [Desulfobulbaceae bacterium]|nr:nodulation protein NfeD [Desulfobulbaceae bacterium]